MSGASGAETTGVAAPKPHYQVLNVGTDATEKEIRTAYLKAARATHPDRNSSSEAAEQFKAVNDAYRTLSDAEKRKAYDSAPANSPAPSPASTQNAADPKLAIADDPSRSAPSPSPAPTKTANESPAAPEDKEQRVYGDLTKYDVQVNLMWEELVKFLFKYFEKKDIDKLEQNKEFKESAAILSSEHGPEKVAKACKDVLKDKEQLKLTDVKPEFLHNTEKSLEAAIVKNDKQALQDQSKEGLTKQFKDLGLEDKAVDKAVKFAMSPANIDPKSGEKHNNQDIAAVVKGHQKEINSGSLNPFKKGLDNTEIAGQLDGYSKAKADFMERYDKLPPDVKERQTVSAERQSEMAASFATSKAGKKYTADEIAEAVGSNSYANSPKDPSNADIGKSIEGIKKLKAKEKENNGKNNQENHESSHATPSPKLH